jgi:anti-sigma-K factor RskA
MNIPQDIQELLAGFVMGDLSPEELSEVNALLESHPELEEEIDRLQFTLSLLPLALPETKPPVSLKASILKELGEPSHDPVPPKKENLLRWWWGMGVVMVALLTGWAFDGYYLRQRIASLEANSTIVATNQMLMLQGMDNNSRAWGVMTLEPRRSRALLQIRNLQPIPNNLTYRLWVVDMNGKRIDCGELRPDANGKVNKEFPLLEPALKGATITLEPMERSPQPQNKTVMDSDV